MPNLHQIQIMPETELGICISAIISHTEYGSATYFMKLFMEKHKEDMIGFWNAKGFNGEELYTKWLEKWTMTALEQIAEKQRKEAEQLEAKIQGFMTGLNYTREQAENFCKMDEKDRDEMMKLAEASKNLGYAKQMEIATDKHMNQKEIVEATQKRKEAIDGFIAKWKSKFDIREFANSYQLRPKGMTITTQEDARLCILDLLDLDGKVQGDFYLLLKSLE
jgi:hypothetical protein